MSGRGICVKTMAGIAAVILFTIMLTFHSGSSATSRQSTSLGETEDYVDSLEDVISSDDVRVPDSDSPLIPDKINQVWNLSPTCQKAKIHTFFTDIKHDFSTLQHQEEATPTLEFLHSAEDLSAIFDRLSPVAFGAVKSDYMGNIEKIMKIYRQNPRESQTLQEMVIDDVRAGAAQESGRAAQSILWLTRSVYFLGTVLDETPKRATFVEAASIAYDTVLRKHHSWLLRPFVSAALQAAPSITDALNAFALTEADKSNPDYIPCSYESAKAFNDQLLTTCQNIDKFFKRQNISILD